MRDGRVLLITVMSFLYLLGSMVGNRLTSFFASPITFAHLLPISSEKIVVEGGPIHSPHEPSWRNLPAIYAPFFFQAIPINSADKELLMTVKGIGPALAESIIAYRQTVGPVKTVEDLTRIPGVGIKRATSLANFLIFDEVP